MVSPPLLSLFENLKVRKLFGQIQPLRLTLFVSVLSRKTQPFKSTGLFVVLYNSTQSGSAVVPAVTAANSFITTVPEEKVLCDKINKGIIANDIPK
jgi:hypothetical protein